MANRVTKIIHEQSRKMQEMKTPCIILEDVTCQARYSACRMHCPKGMYPYWREIWLERVNLTSKHTRRFRRNRNTVVEQILRAPEREAGFLYVETATKCCSRAQIFRVHT